MKNGKILYTKKDTICFIKMYDAIKYSNTSGFDVFIEQLLHDETITDVLIDLCATTYIDSTNLGLMAEIATFISRKFNRKPKLLSTNVNITSLIENVGFDKVFTLIKSSETYTGNFQKIYPVEQNEYKKAKMILDAHKNLIALNDTNNQQFKNVVDLLEDQIKKLPE